MNDEVALDEHVERDGIGGERSRRSTRALTDSEYAESRATDETYLARDLILVLGWIPIGIVALVAGIVVALITSNWWLFLAIALGGTILGYLAAMGAIIVYEVVDIRWLRLGRAEDAWFVILFITGPGVALLVAILIPSLASDVRDASGGFISSSWDIVRGLLGIALAMLLARDVARRLQGD